MVPSESLLLDNFNGEQVLDLDVPKNITNPIEKSDRAHVKIYGILPFFKSLLILLYLLLLLLLLLTNLLILQTNTT